MKYAKANELLVRSLLYNLTALRYLKEDMCMVVNNGCFGIKVITDVSQEKGSAARGMKWEHLGGGLQLAIAIN